MIIFLIMILWPFPAYSYTSLRGSKAVMRRQNILADKYKIERMKNIKMLRNFSAAGKLVRLSDEGRGYFLSPHLGKLDPNNRDLYKYTRTYTQKFILDLSSKFFDRFGKKIKITSLVRTEEYQRRLRRVNRNAAPAKHTFRSSHLTGATFDLSVREMSKEEIIWTEKFFKKKIRAGKIFAIRERRGGCFHIMVLPIYLSVK